jgi:hypothetical protein
MIGHRLRWLSLQFARFATLTAVPSGSANAMIQWSGAALCSVTLLDQSLGNIPG